MNGNRILTQLRIIMSVHSSKFRIVSIILVAAASLSLLLLKHNVAKKRGQREQLLLLHNPPPLSSCVRPAIPASDGDDSVVDHRRMLRGLVEGTNSSSHTNTAAATTAPGTSAYRAQTPIDIPEHYFKSSPANEDQMLMQWFRNICGGTYIEMGANDGITFSNSFVFNRALEWKGVLIELSKDKFDEATTNRPNEIARIHAGVCSTPQTLHSVDDGLTGAIWEFTAPSFRDIFWKDLKFDDERVTEVECDTLDSLLLKHVPEVTYFDFYSLDVEGAELSVLESIDFNRINFGVIVVEADDNNPMKNLAVRYFLENKGYSFLEHRKPNYWFVNANFYDIYKHLLGPSTV